MPLQLESTGSVKITGTEFGQDKDTQITTFINGEVLTLQRDLSSFIRIDVDKTTGYTVILMQDGVTKVVTLNGGGDSTIKMSQGG